MKALNSLSIAILIISISANNYADPNPIQLSRSVLKILAISADGKQHMGSGVVIAKNKVATNCHVTREASRVYLVKENRLYSVHAQAIMADFDVCILKSDKMTLPIAPLAETKQIKEGDAISIYGYPYALRIRMMSGRVIGLHTYANENIIEINTGFTHGASGGAVFNSKGELIGLMTFMGQPDDMMHYYSVPVSWLKMGLAKEFVPMKVFKQLSFWEKGLFNHRD